MAESGYGPIPFQGQNPLVAQSRTPQTEMYAQLLSHLQGAFATGSQIDMTAPVGEDDPSDVKAGMVVHLDASTGTFMIGLGGNNIPYFAKPAGGYAGVPKEGNVYGDGILALPAVAPYRLVTNNYVTGTYAANQPLTVTESGSDKGLLTAGTYYDDPIVAITARGVLEDYDKPGRDVLEFFTYWLPELDAYSSSYLA